METKQALVTCGGTGYRLRKAGMQFPLSKSFIEFEGQPMLHWCLLGLYQAGIERVVIVGDGEEKVSLADHVLSKLPYEFSRVDFYVDSGLGSNGLPYHTKHLLDERFFFECGHSMSHPEHYQSMDRLVTEDEIILSQFKPNSYAPRPRVRIEENRIEPIPELTGLSNEFSVGSPRILNQKYISRLPELNYDLTTIINFYASNGLLKLMPSDLPIEVDVIQEWTEAVPAYQSHITKLTAEV